MSLHALEITIKRDNGEYAQAFVFDTRKQAPALTIQQALEWLEINMSNEFWDAIDKYL